MPLATRPVTSSCVEALDFVRNARTVKIINQPGEAPVIPVMILFGLLAGRWWKSALIAGSAGWTLVLLATGVIGLDAVPGALLLGLLNTAVGVGIHQGLLRLVRRTRRTADAPAAPAAV